MAQRGVICEPKRCPAIHSFMSISTFFDVTDHRTGLTFAHIRLCFPLIAVTAATLCTHGNKQKILTQGVAISLAILGTVNRKVIAVTLRDHVELFVLCDALMYSTYSDVCLHHVP